MLGQIEVTPQILPTLFPALLQTAQTTGSFDGLESVFLTLLNAAEASGNQPYVTAAIHDWRKIGKATSVPSAANVSSYDPVLFYNVTDRTLTLLSFDALAQLRPGGSNFGLSLRGPAWALLLRNWALRPYLVYSLLARRPR